MVGMTAIQPVLNSALDTRSLSAKVSDRILLAIVQQEIAAGAQLDVDSIAEAFGVSRTPVVMALSSLKELGVVEVRPRKGTFVTVLTTPDVKDLFEMRMLVETYGARKGAVLATDAELDELNRLTEQAERHCLGDAYTDHYSFLERNQQFHSAIVALAKNKRLIHTYGGIEVLLDLTRAATGMDSSGAAATVREHRAINEALQARDANAAAAAVELHIRNSEEIVLAVLNLPDH